MDASDLTIDCYVRAASPSAPVDEAIQTLREYDQRGVIDGLTVEGWPDEVVLGPVTDESSPIAQYRRFRTWADQADVSLRPGFTTRERTSLVGDRTKAALVLPVLCLAVHVDGELTTVVPHRTDAAVYTVEDALGDLAAPDRTVPLPLANASRKPPAPS